MSNSLLLRSILIATIVAAFFGRLEEVNAQSGCFSHRCRVLGNPPWPMMHTDNTNCPANFPVDGGRLDFGHGTTFFRVTLSADSSSFGSQPCVNPARGSDCTDIGKAGFIYAGDPYNELITQAEFDSRVQYICDNGSIRPGSTVSAPPPEPSDLPPASPPSNPLPPPPPAACADVTDNDGDGLTDLSDPGCTSSTDNDESDGTSQCQNGRDDDNDGLVDLSDPGCSSRTDNDESDEPIRLSLIAECVFSDLDGGKTAFFSYNNSSGGELTVPFGASGTTVNQFGPSAIPSVEISTFRSGALLGAVGVHFSGTSIEWRVRPLGSALAVATADANTPPCKKLVPSAVCQGFLADGILRVRYGYSNANLFDVILSVGQNNGFAPGTPDRGQPTTFFKGLNANGVEIQLKSPTENITWNLTGNSASNSSLPSCTGECNEFPVGNVKAELNQVAVQLANLTKAAAQELKQAAVNDSRNASNAKKSDTAKKIERASVDDFVDAERAIARADEQIRVANQLLLEIPSLTITCPNAPRTCKKVDRINTIDGLRALYAEARNAIKRITARTNFRKSGQTKRNEPAVVNAIKLEQKGLSELDKVPRFAEECSK